MRKRRKREVTPHVCPGSGDLRPVTVEGLESVGLDEEAERLRGAVKKQELRTQRPVQESAVALSVFGCCRASELAAKVNLS